jgi:caffeoyl-CoA O-methyltransferase
MFNFYFLSLDRYILQHTSPPSDILVQIERDTWLRTKTPQMISGHIQGRILSLISRLKKPQYILEIGAFTGYSAICLAEGLEEGGRLDTIEKEAELEFFIRNNLKIAHQEKTINLLMGDAMEIIPTLKSQYDLIFLDADKKNYLKYYELLLPKLAQGGLLIADNVLWFGKVVNPQDADAVALDQFNKYVQADSRVSNFLLPVRDGLMIVEKTGNDLQ